MTENVFVSNQGTTGRFARRALLQGSAAAVAATAVLGTGQAGAVPLVFRHGVASGDPLPDGVILWTRVTVSDEATPGSGLGDPAAVRWEVATDERFASITASGNTTATADADHTVKIDVSGLAPAVEYFYRFHTLGQTSPVGRTTTAPAAEQSPDRLRFGVVSCANWEAGYFSAYRHLADRGDLDAIVHLGDYLYEYGNGEYGGRAGTVRPHEPATETISLADYRIRHAQYKTDPDLLGLHATVPFICTWDDHESADNSWSGGANNHNPFTEGSWPGRRAASAQAYLEWMPVRAAGSGSGAEVQLYRRLRFGTLAELSMLDLRSYRDHEATPGAGWRVADDPARTITGKAQMEWLTAGLASAPVRWKLVGNSVMIAPLVFPPLEPTTTAAITGTMGIPRSGLSVNGDQWDGYTADRTRLFRTITEQQISDVVFLTGDIHSSWAADLPVEAAHYPGGETVGTEFVVPSVTSSSLGDILGASTAPIAESVKTVNRHMRYAELDSHGYGVLEVTAEHVQMDWYYVLNVTDPNSAVRHGASFAARSGGRLEQRPGPFS
ncbi:alkaline phosphatase D family protein [Nocardia sp. 004]|uniref:alkaline phosphatase D family protein n=1 Tax=Nocardia sp. 004 TaxID=3385978 RepID=UPI0039A2257D